MLAVRLFVLVPAAAAVVGQRAQELEAAGAAAVGHRYPQSALQRMMSLILALALWARVARQTAQAAALAAIHG
jgi:hypothetical protein